MSSVKTIFILGGYGTTGKCVCQLLLQQKADVRIIIAGRREIQAKNYALFLNSKYSTDIVSYAYCDPSIPSTLAAIKGSNITIVLSPNSKEIVQIAMACIQYSSDFYDVIYSSTKVASLKLIADQIKKSGLLFITDGGYHPGMPAIFSRKSLEVLPKAVKILSYSVIKEDFVNYNFSANKWGDFVEELTRYEACKYELGKKKKVSLLGKQSQKTFDFGRFGKAKVSLMNLEELNELSIKYPLLNEIAFYVWGFSSVTNNVVIPLILMIGKWFKKCATKLFEWSLKYSKGPFYSVLRTEASCDSMNFVIEASHSNMYMFTGIAIVACILQYLRGEYDYQGLITQGMLCNPTEFIRDCQSMGMTIKDCFYRIMKI